MKDAGNPVKLPMRLKAAEAVGKEQKMTGIVPVRSLKRLTEALAAPAGELQISLQFFSHAIALGAVRGTIQGQMPLVCQRSLAVFQWPLDVSFHWLLVRGERDEERLLAEADPVMLDDDQLLLHDAIEDEVLLALPIVPMAPETSAKGSRSKNMGDSETTAPTIGHNVELDDSRPNPFAALKGKLPKR
jgi:uncharacterized protein